MFAVTRCIRNLCLQIASRGLEDANTLHVVLLKHVVPHVGCRSEAKLTLKSNIFCVHHTFSSFTFAVVWVVEQVTY